MKRFLLALGVAATISVSGALLAPAGAAEGRSVSLSPLRSTWFTIELAPGEQFRGEAVLANLLNETVEGYLYSADGFTTPQGGFALAERKDLGHGVASWAGMPPRRMSLKPHEVHKIAFTVKLPALAEPGDYTGGLVFERDRQASGGKANASFGLIERVGARIYLTVAGALRPSLKVTSLKRNGSHFEMTVLNNGNQHVTPKPSLVVTSMLGRKTRITLDAKPEALYPQQTVTYKGTWSRPGLLGHFKADAKVSWEGGPADAPLAGSAARRSSFWLIPWLLIVVVLAAAAALVSGVRRGVRWLRRARLALQAEKVETPLVTEVPVMPASQATVAAPAPVASPLAVVPFVAEAGPRVASRATTSRKPARVQAKRPARARPARARPAPVSKGRGKRPKAGTISKPRRKPVARSSSR